MSSRVHPNSRSGSHRTDLPATSAKTARRTRPSDASTASSSEASSSPPPSPSWTFLTNHSHVLILLARHPQITLREVALQVGITERAVQRIIVELETGRFIEREKVGRQNRYRILTDQALRHPIEAHRSIGDLLDLLTPRPHQ